MDIFSLFRSLLKNRYFSRSLVFIALLGSSNVGFGDLIAKQGFESGIADTWTYTATPVAYALAGHTWKSGVRLGDIDPVEGDNFWIMQNLYTGSHCLAFSDIDISDYDNVQIQIGYYGIIPTLTHPEMGYDYMLFYDHVGQTPESFPSTSGWQVLTIDVPDSVGTLSLSLMPRSLNSSEGAGGWDNITMTGNPVPEPTTALLLTVCILSLVGYRINKR